MAEAELRVQKDQKNDIITSTTKKIEQLISELGIALMEDEFFIDAKTQTLRKLLDRSSDASTNLGYGDFGSVFESLFPTTPSVKQRKPPSVQTTSQSQEQKSKESNIPANTPSTHITALVQGFLEQISPDLEIKRSGAWQALDSGTQDGPSQAVHSMREVLRQMLDILAPATKIQEASWYKKPKDGPLVTRSMKIRYALTGTANVKSESTLSLINGMAETINSMYAKLSAESHSNTRSKISSVRMYLNACESLIGLIVTERKV